MAPDKKKYDTLLGLLCTFFGFLSLCTMLVIPFMLFIPATQGHKITATETIISAVIATIVLMWLGLHLRRRTANIPGPYGYLGAIFIVLAIAEALSAVIDALFFNYTLADNHVYMWTGVIYYAISAAAFLTAANFFHQSKYKPLMQRVRPWTSYVLLGGIGAAILSIIGITIIKSAGISKGVSISILAGLFVIGTLAVLFAVVASIAEILYGVCNFERVTSRRR